MKSMFEQFKDYAATRNPDEEYNFGDICGCAFYQFLRDSGHQVRTVGGWSWIDTNFNGHKLPLEFKVRTKNSVLQKFPRTWGALTERLANV